MNNNTESDEPKTEMINVEFWEGHREQIENAAKITGNDFHTLIRAATLRAVREVEDTGELRTGRGIYRYERLTGVRGPNGGIFVSFEMSATVYKLIDQLLNKYALSPVLHMERVAQCQMLKIIETLRNPEELVQLIDRDADLVGKFLKQHDEFTEEHPAHAERVESLLEDLKANNGNKGKSQR